jgi:hypothetical protein
VVLKAFRTLESGSFSASSAAAEPSAGTTSESKVSKFSGLLMSTTTLPLNWSARSARTWSTAGYGTARITTSPVTGLSLSVESNSSTVLPLLATTDEIACPMLPLPMMLTCVMLKLLLVVCSTITVAQESCSYNLLLPECWDEHSMAG